MSLFGSLFYGDARGYEEAFGAADCTSDAMKAAIAAWYRLFYQEEATEEEDPCARIPYTVVNKICKTCFGEYAPASRDGFARQVLEALDRVRKPAMQAALIGGEAYLKPFPAGEGFSFSVVQRSHALVFSRDADGNPTDLGTAEHTAAQSGWYTLLERRTVGSDGLLTIRNRLYQSETAGALGRPVPLASLPRYAGLPDSYTYPEPAGLGLVRMKTPVSNCVDGGPDGVSVYAAAAGLIRNINRNEALLNGEFERGQSRVFVSGDLLERDGQGRRRIGGNLFVGLDENPEEMGITIFSPALREASFLARKTEYLRGVETVIGLKRGLLSEVEAAEKTATEITSSAGDYNLTIIDFQQMWEKAAKDAVRLCGRLGRLHGVPGAHDMAEEDVAIDWGNGVLYDENKTWTDYKAMVAGGLLRPEIAVGWYFGLPTDTPEALAAIRERYMPQLEALAGGEA